MGSNIATAETLRFLSAHGRARARQRGLTGSMIAALAAAGDRIVPVGTGCVAVSISRAGHAEACAEGLPPSVADRLKGKTMVVAEDGTIVTLLVRQRVRGRSYFGRGQRRCRGRRGPSGK